MRKQNLPIQRLLSHEALVTLANEMRHADVSALYAAVGEMQVSAQTVVHRLVQSLGGESSAEEDLAEVTRPGAPRAQPDRRPGVGSRASATSGPSWRSAARRCPATTSSASSRAAPG